MAKNAKLNGLRNELKSNINEHHIIINKNKNIIRFKNFENHYVYAGKNLFQIKKDCLNKKIPKANGCKRPDDCYIDEKNKIIFIIELKYQKYSGSVCEKIQSYDFKLYHYSLSFLDYKIVYMYALSNWFKNNCKAEINYFKVKNIPYFWCQDKNYKIKIINYINNYKN